MTIRSYKIALLDDENNLVEEGEIVRFHDGSQVYHPDRGTAYGIDGRHQLPPHKTMKMWWTAPDGVTKHAVAQETIVYFGDGPFTLEEETAQ